MISTNRWEHCGVKSVFIDKKLDPLDFFVSKSILIDFIFFGKIIADGTISTHQHDNSHIFYPFGVLLYILFTTLHLGELFKRVGK